MNALTVSNTTDIMPIIEQMDGLRQLGETLIKSGMLPKAIEKPEAAIAIILKGRELGIGPMEAFSSINVIQGKPTISPQLMIALAERSGKLEGWSLTDDGQCCTVTVTRRDRAPFTTSFSMEDAKNMQLAGKDNWKKQPKVMRQWRAISAAFRVVFADVLAGLYTPEEMGATVDEEGSYVVDAAIETAIDPWDEPRVQPPPGDEVFIERLEELLPGDAPFWCETPEGDTFRKAVHATKNEISKLCLAIRAKKRGDHHSPTATEEIETYTNKLYREVFARSGVEGSKDPALTDDKAVEIMSVLQGRRNELNEDLRGLMNGEGE